ncbi:MAG: hypothetical protein M1285_03005 [Candidatus Thermoplasmatota archaeon]|jgi:hypothetical protein|nr:hypothetical protein [Candidatus Thermoplasmatota archaeon]
MEIIRRKATVRKETFDTTTDFSMQVSYNSSGHIVLRFFEPNGENDDTLVTLTVNETRELVRFVNMLKL